MNTPPDQALATTSQSVVTIDAIWTAQQFERINVTLEFMREAAEKQSLKEESQDQAISGLVKDMADVKADVRAIKDAKQPKVPPLTWVVGVVAVSGFALGLLNQLYGA